MDVKKLKDILNDERGQAIFETIIFLPVLMLLMLVLVQVGNAVNGAINQNKAVRGYAHSLLKGNSMGNRRRDLAGIIGQNSALVDVTPFIITWRNEGTGPTSFASCYKLPKFLGSSTDNERCKDPISGDSSQFIKVFTAYGVCGENFAMNFGKGIISAFRNDPNADSNGANCDMK